MSKRAVESLAGRWSKNLYDIARKIEALKRRLKAGNAQAGCAEKIMRLARNANSIALKLIPYERSME